MDVWRLASARYRDTALSGVGARLAGGRWNSPGVAIAYTSSSLELAVLEALAHLDLDTIPDDYLWLRYSVPDGAISTLDSYPQGWDAPGSYRRDVQTVGDEWVRTNVSLGLIVRSAVLPIRENLLINPAHAQAGEIRLVEHAPFEWPPRLVDVLQSLGK